MTIPEIVLSEDDLDAIDEMKAKDAVTVMGLPTRLDAHGSRLHFEDEDGPHIVDFCGMGSRLRLETALGLPKLLAELYNREMEIFVQAHGGADEINR